MVNIKNLEEITTGWFIRDEEANVILSFEELNMRKTVIDFNGFVPLSSSIGFLPSEGSSSYDFVPSHLGKFYPRFRGRAIFHATSHVEIFDIDKYKSLSADEDKVFTGIHRIKNVIDKNYIVFVSEFVAIEVKCAEFDFYATELFN